MADTAGTSPTDQSPTPGTDVQPCATQDWRSTLPTSMQEVPIITRHHTPDAMAKSLVAQDEMLGRALFLPKEEPGSEAYRAGMDQVYSKLGRPGTPEEYALTAPEGRTMDTEIVGRWQRAFHQAGMSQAQAQQVLDAYFETVAYAELHHAERARVQEAAGRQALEAALGASTDQLVRRARGFAEEMGSVAFGGKAGEQMWDEIQRATLPDGSMLRNSPSLMLALSEAAQRLGVDAFLEASTATGRTELESLTQRQHALTAKRHSPEGLSQDEFQELLRVNQRVLTVRERSQARGGR